MSRKATLASHAEDPRSRWGRWTAPAATLLLVPLWRRQHDPFYEPCSRAHESFFQRLVLQVAAQDWLLLGYLIALLALVLVGDGTHRPAAVLALTFDVALFAGAVWWVRSERETGFVAALVYRLGILVALLGSFSELQWILPAASGQPVDAQLHALDLQIFGVEPSVAWDRFVRPETTEWFAFFYYGYFFLVGVHVLPALFFGRCEKFLTTFGFGFLWLYCVGHVVYTFVPAYGPYAQLHFQHPLEGGLWWQLVKNAVASGGARTDVFPSLHTAGPTFLTLYSFVNRKTSPFRYTWPPLAFCALQIIGATMFLRWHYLIDICAGILLAASGVAAGRLAYAWERARVDAGGRPAWPAFRRTA